MYALFLCFQHHRPVSHVHPVDRPHAATLHDRDGVHGLLSRAAQRRQRDATVPRHLPRARDERVEARGRLVRQTHLRVPLCRDTRQVDTTSHTADLRDKEKSLTCTG